MEMPYADAIGTYFAPHGFIPTGKKLKGTLQWDRDAGRGVHHEIYLQESTWKPGHFGCSVRVTYYAHATKPWTRGKPFLFELWSRDFLPTGLSEPGTPGAACWPCGSFDRFVRSFAENVLPEFAKYQQFRDVIERVTSQSKENPHDVLLQYALAFMHLEVGEKHEASTYFKAYLTRFPRLRENLAPMIEELLARG